MSEGLFRSDKFLVARRGEARFSNRCVRCHDSGVEEHSDIAFRYTPVRARSLIGAVAAVAAKRTCTIQMPLCEKCKKRAHSGGNKAALIGLGLGALALLLVVLVANGGLPPDDKRLIPFFVLSTILLAGGFIAIFAGYEIQKSTGRMAAAYMDDGVIWIRGIHSAWLNTLPVWSGRTLAEYYRLR